MRLGRQYGLSAERKADIWRRWKAGESLHAIGRAFGIEKAGPPTLPHQQRRTISENARSFTADSLN